GWVDATKKEGVRGGTLGSPTLEGRASRRLGVGRRGDLLSRSLEKPANGAGRLVDALLVLDEREAHVTVAARPEADAAADRHVGLARELQGDLERAELGVLVRDRRPDEHRPERRLDVPTGAGEPVAERVAAAAVDLADLDRVVGRLAQRHDRRDLDRLERPVV